MDQYIPLVMYLRPVHHFWSNRWVAKFPFIAKYYCSILYHPSFSLWSWPTSWSWPPLRVLVLTRSASASYQQGSPVVTQRALIVPSAMTSTAYILCFGQVDLSIWVVIDLHTASAKRHGPTHDSDTGWHDLPSLRLDLYMWLVHWEHSLSQVWLHPLHTYSASGRLTSPSGLSFTCILLVWLAIMACLPVSWILGDVTCTLETYTWLVHWSSTCDSYTRHAVHYYTCSV